MVFMIAVGFYADRFKRKGLPLIVSYLIYAILWTVFSETHVGMDKWGQFAQLTMIGTLNHIAIPINKCVGLHVFSCGQLC